MYNYASLSEGGGHGIAYRRRLFVPTSKLLRGFWAPPLVTPLIGEMSAKLTSPYPTILSHQPKVLPIPLVTAAHSGI